MEEGRVALGTDDSSAPYDKTSILDIPPPNFIIRFGEQSLGVSFEFRVNKTFLNKLKWWLFCRVFPVRIIKWEKEKTK